MHGECVLFGQTAPWPYSLLLSGVYVLIRLPTSPNEQYLVPRGHFPRLPWILVPRANHRSTTSGAQCGAVRMPQHVALVSS